MRQSRHRKDSWTLDFFTFMVVVLMRLSDVITDPIVHMGNSAALEKAARYTYQRNSFPIRIRRSEKL